MNILRKTREFLVAAYARRQYNEWTAKADRLHETTGGRWHVIYDPRHESLSLVEENAFLSRFPYSRRAAERRKLLSGSFYHTPGPNNSIPLSLKERELRRLAFLHLILQKSQCVP